MRKSGPNALRSRFMREYLSLPDMRNLMKSIYNSKILVGEFPSVFDLRKLGYEPKNMSGPRGLFFQRADKKQVRLCNAALTAPHQSTRSLAKSLLDSSLSISFGESQSEKMVGLDAGDGKKPAFYIMRKPPKEEIA